MTEVSSRVLLLSFDLGVVIRPSLSCLDPSFLIRHSFLGGPLAPQTKLPELLMDLMESQIWVSSPAWFILELNGSLDTLIYFCILCKWVKYLVARSPERKFD